MRNETGGLLRRVSTRLLCLSPTLISAIMGTSATWPLSASARAQGDPSSSSSSPSDEKPSDAWRIIKADIQTAQTNDDAARRADRIAASFNMVDARIWSQPDAKVIHIDGQSRTVGASASVGFADSNSTATDETVFFEIHMPVRNFVPTPCVSYSGLVGDLRALGGGNRLDEDIGLEGLHLHSATVILRSKTLLASVHFYMPANNGGPVCLYSVSVRNYDGGLPGWAKAARP